MSGQPGPPRVLGITGGIGVGKSALCRLLVEAFQLPAIDADALGHEALHSGTTVYEALVATFGEELLDPTGRFDRKKLGALVFSDPEALSNLNAIVHPWILERIELRVAALKASGYAGIILLDAALLLEWLERFRPDGIVLVTASREIRLARLSARGLTREDAERRMDAQRPEEDWIREATWIVPNDGDLAELEGRARKLYAEAARAWNLVVDSRGEQ